MFADNSFTSALGGDGWYRATQVNAGATSATTFQGTPTSIATYQGEGTSGGQFQAVLLAVLILGYVGYAYWSRKHSL
jgi:hypothetical protein